MRQDPRGKAAGVLRQALAEPEHAEVHRHDLATDLVQLDVVVSEPAVPLQLAQQHVRSPGDMVHA
jgi:hypothetical protein